MLRRRRKADTEGFRAGVGGVSLISSLSGRSSQVAALMCATGQFFGAASMKTLTVHPLERVLLLVSTCLVVLFALLWIRSLHEREKPIPAGVQVAEGQEGPSAPAALVRPLPPRPSSLPAQEVGSLVQEMTQNDSRFVRHEKRFSESARGGAWVNQARESLLDAATEPALTTFGMPTSFNADCSSSMCRVAMDFDSRSAADDWAEFFPLGMGKEFGAVDTLRTETPDGRHVLLLYGARIGQSGLITVN